MTPRKRDDGSGENLPAVRLPEPLPWERQKGESRVAFSNFAYYRDLGPHRSLAKAAIGLSRSVDTLSEQSSKNRWVERSTAYDDDYDRRMREERETERMQLERGQLALGTQMVSLALVRMAGRAPVVDGTKLLEGVDPLDANALAARDVAALALAGVRIQRQASGLPTDILRGLTAVDAHDVVKVVKDVVEILMPFVPEERRSRANSELDTYFNTGRRW